MIINMNGAKAPETPSPVLQEKTITPETLPTVIGADEGYDGLSQVTVNPDSQLKAENIRSGKTIFGVEGAFVGEKQVDPTAVWDATQAGIRVRPQDFSEKVSGMSWSPTSTPASDLLNTLLLPDNNYLSFSGNIAWLNESITEGTFKYSNLFETQAPEYHFTGSFNFSVPYEFVKGKSYTFKMKYKLFRCYRDSPGGGLLSGELVQKDDMYDGLYETSGTNNNIIAIPLDQTFTAKTVYTSHYSSTPPKLEYVTVWAVIEKVLVEVTE